MDTGATYRTDVRYITICKRGTCQEFTVNRFRWWLYRAQVWRFRKMRGFNVLRSDTWAR